MRAVFILCFLDGFERAVVYDDRWRLRDIQQVQYQFSDRWVGLCWEVSFGELSYGEVLSSWDNHAIMSFTHKCLNSTANYNITC